MNTYINNYGSTSCSISSDITDSSDMKSINFTNTAGVKFIKTFYLSCRNKNEYNLIIINVKLIGKSIYIYRIIDNKRKLLRVFDSMENINNVILCNLVRVDTNWEILTIPSESHIILISVKSIAQHKLKFKKITMDLSLLDYLTKHKKRYSVYPYRDRLIIMYQNKNNDILLKTMYCDTTEKNDSVLNLNKLFNSSVNIENIRTSDNGNYILHIQSKYNKEYSKVLNAYDLLTTEMINFNTSKIKIDKEHKFLISNDGKMLLCKYRNFVYVLTKGSIYEVGKYIPDYKGNFEKYSLSIIKVGLYDDICSNVVVFWNKDNQNFYFLGVNLVNGKIHISDRYNKSLDSKIINRDTKISTNGKIYIYKSDEKTKINDISLLLYIPLIRSYLKVLLEKLKLLTNSGKIIKIKEYILLGNLYKYPKSIKKSKLTDNIRLVLNPVHKDDKFILETYDRLDIPIIENENKNSDVLHVVMSIIDDINNSDILFDSIRDDELYDSKIDLVIDLFKDIYEKVINCENKELTKRYIELCMLYVIISHKLISARMSTIIKSVCSLIGIKVDRLY